MQRLLGDDGFPLGPGHLLYLSTSAGAAALGLADVVGDLSEDQQFGVICLRPPVGTALDIVLRYAGSPEEALGKVFALASDADVADVWSAGCRSRPAATSGRSRAANLLRMRPAVRLAHAFALAALVPLLSSCTDDVPTVALLVADGASSTHVVDVEAFEERVAATCDECEVTVYDAEDDAAQQKSQARQAEAESADVLVVVPVEPDEMEAFAHAEVPMVSLGTLVPGAEHHIGLRRATDAEGDSGDDLSAARDLILGERSAMTYVPTVDMSVQAADVAVAVLADTEVPAGKVESEGAEGVESWLFESQDVTLDTLTTLLVGQKVLTLDELCEGETAKKCAKLGLR